MGKVKVMIVDDDEEFLSELKETLELNDFKTTAVNDSSKVIKAARKIKPDIVLLDLKMPKKSGFAVAAELKQIPELACVPIIAMSACYKDGDFPLLRVHGITKCLSKPFNPETVIDQISLSLVQK